MQLYQAVHGGPQPGITQKLDAVLKELHTIAGGQRQKENDQEARHQENSDKLDKQANRTQVLIFLVLFMTLVVGALGVLVGYVEGHRAGLIPPNILHTETNSEYHASNGTELAGPPAHY